MDQLLNRADAPTLAYRFSPGNGQTLIFLPGYRSDMTGGKASAIAEWASANGLACLRFDYRGCGASAGVFGEAGLDDWLADVLDLIDQVTAGPLVLVGSSMGGWLMLLAALARPERVRALVGIAAAPDFTEWGFDDDQRTRLAQDGLIVEAADEGTPPMITTERFWSSGQALRLLDQPIDFAGPVRLLHGLHDTVVPTSVALRLTRALRSPDVQLCLVKDGDHRLSRPQDLRLLLATVATLIEVP